MGLLEHHLPHPRKRAKKPVQVQPDRPVVKRAVVEVAKTAIVTKQPTRLYPKALRNTFRKYFNHPFNAILKPQDGEWFTRSKPLDPEQIWELWRSASTLIGLGFGEWTRYAVIDIDHGGRYHNEESLNDIRECLEEIGVYATILIQSSSSGGWHLWIIFDRPLKSFGVACLLTEQLASWGFDIENGHLEIFPNRKGRSQKAVTNYNRVRLPLQPDTGAAILDDDFAPYSQDIAVFLRLMEETAIANDADLIEGLGESAWDRFRELKKDRNGNPKNYRGSFAVGTGAKAWFKEMDEAIRIGQTGHIGGEDELLSNELLRYIAAKGRVRLGLGGQELADYIYQTMVSNPGYDKCQHQKEMPGWAVRWARSAEKNLYPYTGKIKPSDPLNPPGPDNEARKADAIERIKKAVAELTESNQLPEMKTARLNAIAKLAHCSERTLYKYPDLWWDVAVTPTGKGIVHDLDNYEMAPALRHGSGKKISTSSSQFSESASAKTSATCTTPGTPPKTKTTQTHTGTEIDAFSEQKTVPITSRLAIVKNSQAHAQQRIQPSVKPGTKIINRPVVVPIADGREIEPAPGSPSFQPGDLVVEVTRPDLLLRLESIDDDGEWCRCRDTTWGKRELCLLSELTEPAIALLEEVANG